MWIAFAFGSAFLAGVTSILAKSGIRKTDSTVATAIRTIIVLIFSWIMVVVIGSQNQIGTIGGKTLLFLILSGAATGASWLCYFKALQLGDVNKVVPIDKSSVVLTILLAFLFLGEPVRGRHVAALVLEVAGTVAIINPFETRLNMVGVALTLAATILFAIYGVMGKKKVAQFGGPVVTCFGFLFGSLIILVFIGLTHIPAVAGAILNAGLPAFANVPLISGYTLENLPVVLYVSAGVAGVGFCAYFMAMEYQPASIVSLVYFFKPALSPVLAWALHGEEIPFNMLLGIILIVAGSFCAIVPGAIEAKKGIAFQRF